MESMDAVILRGHKISSSPRYLSAIYTILKYRTTCVDDPYLQERQESLHRAGTQEQRKNIWVGDYDPNADPHADCAEDWVELASVIDLDFALRPLRPNGRMFQYNALEHNINPTLGNITRLKFGFVGDVHHPLNEFSLACLPNLLQLDLGYFDFSLGNSLKPFTQLVELNLDFLKHPLGNSLAVLPNLKKLSMCLFNQPLGESLASLAKLEQLELWAFNQPLANSLRSLTNLKHLSFGEDFDQGFGDSLTSLKNLTYLKYGTTVLRPDDESFQRLINAQR